MEKLIVPTLKKSWSAKEIESNRETVKHFTEKVETHLKGIFGDDCMEYLTTQFVVPRHSMDKHFFHIKKGNESYGRALAKKGNGSEFFLSQKQIENIQVHIDSEKAKKTDKFEKHRLWKERKELIGRVRNFNLDKNMSTEFKADLGIWVEYNEIPWRKSKIKITKYGEINFSTPEIKIQSIEDAEEYIKERKKEAIELLSFAKEVMTLLGSDYFLKPEK